MSKNFNGPDFDLTQEMIDTLTQAPELRRKDIMETPEIISEFPDRLCIEHTSRFFSTSCTHVGVKLSVKGGEQYETNNIVEYCASGRWVRMGRRDESGKLVRNRKAYETTRYENVDIELYWRYGPSRQVRRALKRVGG